MWNCGQEPTAGSPPLVLWSGTSYEACKTVVCDVQLPQVCGGRLRHVGQVETRFGAVDVCNFKLAPGGGSCVAKSYPRGGLLAVDASLMFLDWMNPCLVL